MKSIDIRRVAKLARLHLEDQEISHLEGQVVSILGFVEQLNEVKGLDAVTPTSHPFLVSDVFRPDEPKVSIDIQEFLKHSPESKGRFFQVPKVIETAS
jgi:aspartyl-tRNA(Asn)/glutamyl-tRNA(Gln) amidotransferase subunit C